MLSGVGKCDRKGKIAFKGHIIKPDVTVSDWGLSLLGTGSWFKTHT